MPIPDDTLVLELADRPTAKPGYSELAARVLHARGGAFWAPRFDPAVPRTTLFGLVISAQVDLDTIGAYDFEFYYRTDDRIDAARTTSMARTLGLLQAHLERDERHAGQPADFATFVLRAASALDVTHFVVTPDNCQPRFPDGARHHMLPAVDVPAWCARQERRLSGPFQPAAGLTPAA